MTDPTGDDAGQLIALGDGTEDPDGTPRAPRISADQIPQLLIPTREGAETTDSEGGRRAPAADLTTEVRAREPLPGVTITTNGTAPAAASAPQPTAHAPQIVRPTVRVDLDMTLRKPERWDPTEGDVTIRTDPFSPRPTRTEEA